MRLQAVPLRGIQATTPRKQNSELTSVPEDQVIATRPKGEPIPGRYLIRMAAGAALPSAIVLAARAVWGEQAATPAIIATAGAGAVLSALYTAHECGKHNERTGMTVASTAISACMGGLAGFTLGAMAMPSQGACALLPFRPEQFGQMATIAAVAAPVLLAGATFLPPYSEPPQSTK